MYRMSQGKTSFLASILVIGLVMAWSIAQVPPTFAQRRGGGGGHGGVSHGGGGGGMSHHGGGFSRGGSGFSRGGAGRSHGSGFSHGGSSFSRSGSSFSHGGSSISRGGSSISRGGSNFSRGGAGLSHGGGFSHGGSSFSHGGSSLSHRGGFSHGGGSLSHGGSLAHGRGGFSRGGTSGVGHYGGRRSYSHFYFRPYGYGYGYYGPSFGIYLGLPLYGYYDYYTYYTEPPYTVYTAPNTVYTTPYVEESAPVESTYAPPTVSANGAVIPALGEAAEFQLQAERAFREHRYEDAARFSNHAIVEDGQNGKLYLFASQTMYALGDFRSAAAAIQQAAALLDRSEWGFVVENYKKFYRGDDYATQTAKLVEFVKEHPEASYAYFLLGYHYKFLGYDEAARRNLAKAVELESRDRLAAELLVMAGGEAPGTAGQPAAYLPPKQAESEPDSTSQPAEATSPNEQR
jgi:hypothetical protein